MNQVFKTKDTVKGFKGSGVYNHDKSFVEHRTAITKKYTHGATQLSKSTTADNHHEQASTSVISSPYKVLKYAIHK